MSRRARWYEGARWPVSAANADGMAGFGRSCDVEGRGRLAAAPVGALPWPEMVRRPTILSHATSMSEAMVVNLLGGSTAPLAGGSTLRGLPGAGWTPTAPGECAGGVTGGRRGRGGETHFEWGPTGSIKH